MHMTHIIIFLKFAGNPACIFLSMQKTNIFHIYSSFNVVQQIGHNDSDAGLNSYK